MSEQPEVNSPLGMDRSPATVLGLSFVTLGIYFLVWYYKINNEVRHHDPLVKVTPGWAVAAMCIPICNLVSGFSTAARIRQMQLDEGATHTIQPLLAAFLLMVTFGIGFPLYVASQLREHWTGHQRRGQLEADAPARLVLPGAGAPGDGTRR
jgi:uncharacterized protein DUF4234